MQKIKIFKKILIFSSERSWSCPSMIGSEHGQNSTYTHTFVYPIKLTSGTSWTYIQAILLCKTRGDLMGSKNATRGYKCWGKVLLGSKWISRICNIIIMSDFHICCKAQTNPKNAILPQSRTKEKDLLTFKFWNLNFPPKMKVEYFPPTFGHFHINWNFSGQAWPTGLRIAPDKLQDV